MPRASIEESMNREQIAQNLQHAHIPSLLCSLVHLTGDLSHIRGDVKPKPVLEGDPMAAVEEARIQEIRDYTLELIEDFQAGKIQPAELDASAIKEMTEFQTGQTLSDEYTEYALSELAIEGQDSFRVDGFNSIPADQKSKFNVAIIGAGMSGLLAAIRLQQAEIPFVVFEKNDDVGGTWLENRYPGCRVDSPNHVYSYSFEPRDWPQHFSDQSVLLSYFQEVAERHELKRHIRFSSEVDELRYSSTDRSWSISVNGETTFVAQAVICAVGQLNRPKFPDIPGQENFQGASFHSAYWDKNVDLEGKRVAIIGTGASAFQFTAEVVSKAAAVDVYLRTPPWVSISPVYREYIRDEKHWLLNNVPFYGKWFRFSMFWTTAEGLLPMSKCDPGWNEGKHSVSSHNDRLRSMLMKGIERVLDGREDLIEKLTPRYPPTAKRMLIDDGGWYTALKQPNVQVLNETIDEIDHSGIRSNGAEHRSYDVILYGTGFHANEFFMPMKIYGESGTELRSEWGSNPRAYRGITIPGYPNLFALYGPNTNLVVNGSIVFFSECEMYYVMLCLRHMLESGHNEISCRPEVHKSYNEMIDARNKQMAWGASDVNSWYKNAEGRITQNWPGSLVEFWQQCRDFNPEDYVFNS